MKTLAFAVWLAVAPNSANDERLQPLEKYLELPAQARTISYPLNRCSGLFVALMRLAGDAMSDETSDELTAWTTRLIRDAAAHIFLEEEIGSSAAMDASIERSDAFASTYLSELKGILARGGNTSNPNALVPSDIRMCRSVVLQLDLDH